jgi:cytidylate kinase
MTEKKPIIAIDGPVGSGKSTTAREVAHELGFIYVDTGAMYRAITLDILEHGANPEDEEAVNNIVAQSHVELLSGNEGRQRTVLNGVDVTDRIRERDVTNAVSAVSAMKSVRDKMTHMQREIGKNGGIVMEGRDIGTVVFPDAEFKFFIDASLEVRARRRHKELVEKNSTVDIDTLIREIKERDRLNTERSLAPLRKAKDAIYIDTSDMTFDEQVSGIASIIRGDKS